MKIIEGLKKVKELEKKINDLIAKVELASADTELDTPLYPDQKAKVAEWMQAIHDLLLEIERLKYRIQKTNVLTEVTIELGNKQITKSISQWILRRQSFAEKEKYAWSRLTDRGLQTQATRSSNTSEPKYYKVRIYFDPQERDKMMSVYSSERSIIDGKLEIVNATTDLLE